MPRIEWNDRYSVGVTIFDEQHKELIAMINELDQAISSAAGQTTVGHVLERMIQYLNSHFSSEEKYMKEYRYPEYDHHRAEHRTFVTQTLEFTKGFREERQELAADIMVFLQTWLIDHIQGSDSKYGPFFRQKGLK